MSLALLVSGALLAAACSNTEGSESADVSTDQASTDDAGDGETGAGDGDDAAAAGGEAADDAEDTATDDDNSGSGDADDQGSAVVGEFIAAPDSCLQTPIFLQNLPSSDFYVMTEDRIFDCLGVDAFQSDVSFDGELPTGPASVVAASTQRLEGGVVSAIGTFSQDGVVTEQLVRIGEDAWERDEAGTWSPVALGLGQLFNEEGELRLSMTGALYLLSVFGGGAEPAGQEELGGRTVTRWEADAAAIESWVNQLDISPVPVGVGAGFVTIWTTDDGLIVQLDGEIRAADVTLAGIPVDQVDPAALGLPADALDIVPDYAMTYELFDFDHDIAIDPPTAG